MVAWGRWPALMLVGSSAMLVVSMMSNDALGLALALPLIAISVMGRHRDGGVWVVASLATLALVPVSLLPEPLRIVAAILGAFVIGHMSIVTLGGGMHRVLHTMTAFMTSNIVLALWAVMSLALSLLMSAPPIDNHEMMMWLGTSFLGLGLVTVVGDPVVHRLLEGDDEG